VIRTVVVDDDFRVANVHAAFVQRMPGYEVVGRAGTGAEAEQFVAQNGADLLLLDLYLPDTNGLDLLTKLHVNRSVTADVIVISAASDVETVRAAMRLGVLHYLVKPFPFEVLRERLQSYATMRTRSDSMRSVSQRQIDALLAALRPVGTPARSKGGVPRTLHAVEELINGPSGGLTAVEVASRIGLSRATAQRYLSHLAAQGRASIELRYRSLGRPEHVYRGLRRRPGPPDSTAPRKGRP
jgi:response regulator of citrate/malate metabolism